MRPIPTPEQCGFTFEDDHLDSPDYDGAAGQLGDVMSSAALGPYQGDPLFLLRDGDRFGFLTWVTGRTSGRTANGAAGRSFGR